MNARGLLLAGAAVLAAGCAQSAKQGVYSAGGHLEPGVRAVMTEMRLEPVSGTGALSPIDEEAVTVFAAAYRSEGSGPVVISRPQGESVDPAAAGRAAGEARAILLAHGLAPSNVREGPFAAQGPAGLILSYETHEAVLPACTDISRIDLASTKSNSALASFGCATATNLALMVVDPRDLVAMRASEPADTTRRVIVMQKYREGQPTSAARAAEASGAISNVVK